MSVTRKRWCALIVLLRSCLLGILCIIGTLFIALTLGLAELLFNCAALSIVLGVDELLHQALEPWEVSKLITLLRPIPRRKIGYWKGLDLTTVSATVCVLIMISITPSVLLKWTHGDGLTCARQALCGGNLGFAVGMDPAGAVVAARATGRQEVRKETWRPLTPKCINFIDEKNKNSYRFRAVIELITHSSALSKNVEESLSDMAAPLDWGYLSLRHRVKIPTEERLGDLNPECVDFSAGSTIWPQRFLQVMVSDAVGMSSTHFTCTTAKSKCGEDSEAGVRLRQWCPVTCGCSLPNSSLAAISSNSGCPPACSSLPSFRNALREASCTDQPKDSPDFLTYIRGIEDIKLSYSGSWAAHIQEWSEQLSLKGCSFHDLGGFGDLCSSNAFKLKYMAFVCPVTCGCPRVPPKGQPNMCPESCNGTMLTRR